MSNCVGSPHTHAMMVWSANGSAHVTECPGTTSPSAHDCHPACTLTAQGPVVWLKTVSCARLLTPAHGLDFSEEQPASNVRSANVTAYPNNARMPHWVARARVLIEAAASRSDMRM